MWYENTWRRHLCDMHIDEWDSSFMASFNPEDYVANLLKAKVKNAMIPVQTHVGLCYYPTKSGKMHNSFNGREDLIKKTIDLCHEFGISVTGYYSLIYNNVEHDRHKNWRMIDENGNSLRELCVQNNLDFAANGVIRTGYCCPNNEQYREFVKLQILEIIDYFTLDGLFFDMLFWPQLCYCDSCKSKWQKEVGGLMPSFDDERWGIHNQKRKEWMTDFANWVAKEVKKASPHISVAHNYAGGLSPSGRCTDEHLNDFCDYVGGDLYDGPYCQSFACKFYKNLTKKQPFEYMFSRCEPNLGMHTTIKSFATMTSAMFLTAAHHGATLIIDAIDPIGTIDSRVYDAIGQVFEQIIPYEKYLSVGNMLEDIGIYYSSKKPVYDQKYSNHKSSLSISEAFIFDNLSHGVIGSYSDFDKYKTIVASCLSHEDNLENERFEQYVKSGGKFYFSGVGNLDLLKRFFNVDFLGFTKEEVVYISPKEKLKEYFGRFNEKYPLPFNGSAPLLEGFDSDEVIANLVLPYTRQDESTFASIHSNPPGIHTNYPAMAMKKIGKGYVLWSALPIESIRELTYKHVFTSLLTNYFHISQSVISNAPYNVELTVFLNGNITYVNLVQINESDRIQSISKFEVAVKRNSCPKNISRVNSNSVIPFSFENGYVRFTVTDLHYFDMYIID